MKKKKIAEQKKELSLIKALEIKREKEEKIRQRIERKNIIDEKKLLTKKKLEQKKLLNEEKKLENKKTYDFKVVSKNDTTMNVEMQDIETNLKKKALINHKLNEKVKLEELARKRNEEIQKRKFSNYVEKKYDEEYENTKFFYDENVVNKFAKLEKKETKKDQVKFKKKLEKKSNTNKNNLIKKDKNTLAAFNTKQPIVKLKNKSFKEKTELFFFKNGEVELDINQKVKISEYVNQIKNKPIKIEIKTISNLEKGTQKNNLNISKSRSLLIRAFLVKLGISHNRISIEIENSDSTVAPNEVLLSFIEL